MWSCALPPSSFLTITSPLHCVTVSSSKQTHVSAHDHKVAAATHKARL